VANLREGRSEGGRNGEIQRIRQEWEKIKMKERVLQVQEELKQKCVCVYVCERERERERDGSAVSNLKLLCVTGVSINNDSIDRRLQQLSDMTHLRERGREREKQTRMRKIKRNERATEIKRQEWEK